MRFSGLVGLSMPLIVCAVPMMTERDLNSTVWTPDHILKPDEVILFGEGRLEVVHESVYQRLIESRGFVPDKPANVPLESRTPQIGPLERRQDCEHTTAVVTDETIDFVDWDVQMSPVVIAEGQSMDISVTSGYQVSNSITVSAGINPTLVKDKLGASFGINYSRTWTSSTSINIKGSVLDGYSGVMITKPLKTRKTGRVMRGCLGEQVEDGTFQADSYEEKSYAGIQWVSGGIAMCMKKEFPLTRCNGEGTFV